MASIGLPAGFLAAFTGSLVFCFEDSFGSSFFLVAGLGTGFDILDTGFLAAVLAGFDTTAFLAVELFDFLAGFATALALAGLAAGLLVFLTGFTGLAFFTA